MIKFETFNTGACVGADGSSTATGYSPELEGEILAISLAYSGDGPSTTNVRIADARDPADEGMLSLNDAATDGRWHPRAYLCDKQGVEHPDKPTPFVIASILKCVIDSANLGDSVEVGVWIRSG